MNRDIIKKYWDKLMNNSLAKDSFWAMVGSVIGKALALLSGIIIARLLGSEAFGEYGTIRNTLTYIAIVSTFGFGYTATKYIAEKVISAPSKIVSLVRTTISVTLVISLFLSFIFTIFAESISGLLKAPELTSVLRFFSVLIVFNALTTTQIAILSGFKMFRETARLNVVAGIVTLAGSIIMTYLWGLHGAVGALLLAYIIQTIYGYILIHKELRNYLIIELVSRREILGMIQFSCPIALQESLYTVIHWALLLLLINYANYKEVGLSSAASIWQSIVLFIPAMLKNVQFSYLSSTTDHKALVGRLVKINFLSTLVPTVVILFVSPIICMFYGETFIGLNEVLIVSVASSIFICIAEVYCYELISTNRPWLVFFSRLLRDVLILVISYIILKQFPFKQAFVVASIALGGNIIYYVILRTIYRRLR